MKLIRILPVVLCLALLWGCSAPFGTDSVTFYYLKSDIEYDVASGVIGSEKRTDFDSSGVLLRLMEQYLRGPDDDALRSPFPEDIQIFLAEQRNETVILEFNDALAGLTGMELTLACACVTMTCLELTDAQNVSIRARGATLDGAAQITIDADSLLLLDSSGQ